MNRRSILKMALATPLAAPAIVRAQAKATVSLWYPAGDITAGAFHFRDKDLFAEFESKHNARVELVALDYDTMQQKIFAAAAAKNVGDILFIDNGWIPGFLKEEMVEPVADAKAKAWLDAVSPEIRELSDYGKGRMWGYPQYGIDVYGLTWNKDHFKEAGLDPEKAPKHGTSSGSTRRSSRSGTRRATSRGSGTPSVTSATPTASCTSTSGRSTAAASAWSATCSRFAAAARSSTPKAARRPSSSCSTCSTPTSRRA